MHENEYLLDGKHYYKVIKECKCCQKFGETYIVECRIIQHGTKRYTYQKSNPFIKLNKKERYLEDDALQMVVSAVESFEKKLSLVPKRFTEAEIPDLEITCFFFHKEGTKYDFLIRNKDGVLTLYEDNSAFSMLREVFSRYAFWIYREMENRDDVYRFYNYPTAEQLERNPLYVAAENNGDKLMQKQMRIYYGLATTEDCKVVENATNKRILPCLSGEFDKMYYVERKTVDFEMLIDSGYSLLHKIGYAMRGFIRNNITLNPKRKTCIDAAPENESAISFEEFLRIFERGE